MDFHGTPPRGEWEAFVFIWLVMFKQISHNALCIIFSLSFQFSILTMLMFLYCLLFLLFLLTLRQIFYPGLYFICSLFSICYTYDIYLYLLFYWLFFSIYKSLQQNRMFVFLPFLCSLFVYAFLHHEHASKPNCLHFFLYTFNLNRKIETFWSRRMICIRKKNHYTIRRKRAVRW